MAEPVTWFAFAFPGAPARGSIVGGWTDVPDEPFQVAARARIALGRAQSTRVRVYRCFGLALDRAGWWCDDAALIGDFAATACLARFARYCAATVQVLWPSPALVREYIATGSPAVRGAARDVATTCADALAGAQRIAARVAMFAACDDERILLAAREAASLAAQLLGASSPQATELAVRRQERFLASTLLAAVPRERISRTPIPEPLAA
jgi:hypothetical protein